MAGRRPDVGGRISNGMPVAGSPPAPRGSATADATDSTAPTESIREQLGRRLPTIVAQVNEKSPGLLEAGDAQLYGGRRFELADPAKWEAMAYYARERLTTSLGEICSAAANDDTGWDADLVRTVVVDDLGIEFATFTKATGSFVIPHNF